MSLYPSTVKMFELVRIPENYWTTARLSLIQDGKHKKFIEEWFENIPENIQEGKGLYLFGEYGVGKSAIASILLKGALAHGIFGLWVNFKPLPQYYKYPNQHMFDHNTTMFQKMLDVPILVIDEFAVTTKDWWLIEIFEEVIRHRVQRRLSTIITSNHPTTYFTDGLFKGSSAEERKLSKITMGLMDILKEAVTSCCVEGESLR